MILGIIFILCFNCLTLADFNPLYYEYEPPLINSSLYLIESIVISNYFDFEKESFKLGIIGEGNYNNIYIFN